MGTAVDRLPRNDLSFPENVPFYLEHLNQLGLAGIFQVGNQEPLFGGESKVEVGIRSRYLSEIFGRFRMI